MLNSKSLSFFQLYDWLLQRITSLWLFHHLTYVWFLTIYSPLKINYIIYTLPGKVCSGGKRMDFFKKDCSGWWKRKVWSITWGWGSTLKARTAIGLPSWVLKNTCIYTNGKSYSWWPKNQSTKKCLMSLLVLIKTSKTKHSA